MLGHSFSMWQWELFISPPFPLTQSLVVNPVNLNERIRLLQVATELWPPHVKS